MLPADAIVDLAQRCAPAVHVVTARALVQQESGGNPYAIGVVGGRLTRQPRSGAEAIATARKLEAEGWNYSIGLTQINRSNFARLGLGIDSGFDPCANLRAMQAVLHECWQRARQHTADRRRAIDASLACYYSGSLATSRYSSYVESVVANARSARCALPDRRRRFVQLIARCAVTQEVQEMKRIEQIRAALALAALGVMATPAWAGGGFGRVQTVFDNVNNVLIAAGVSIMTMAILWCGYRVTFRGATFEDVSKPLVGGIILGTAPVLAGFLMT